MAAQPRKNKQYKLNEPMSKGTFQAFVRHFPNKWLRNAGSYLNDGYQSIDRLSFYAIAHGLVEVGDFKNGENFRLSQVAIADITGASPKTVRRVLALLEMSGAIKVTELSRRPGGGKPVKNYMLVFSSTVREVLRVEDRNAERESWKRDSRPKMASESAMGSTTPSQEVAQPQSMGSTTPANGEHNPIRGMSTNVKPASEASAPSPSPNGSPPDGRAEASEDREKEGKTTDELIASSWLDGVGLDELIAEMEAAP